MKIGGIEISDRTTHMFAFGLERRPFLLRKTGTWRYLRPVLKERQAPCTGACPALIDMPDYLRLLQDGRIDDAWELLKRDNPFPSVTGRVCYHPCETSCNRAEFDEPIAIHALERFVGDHGLEAGLQVKVEPRQRERIALIGSGPASLAAAYFLTRDGYEATIFESLPLVGGMLRVGIPEYRLPRHVLEAEIQGLTRMGVEIRTGVALGHDFRLDDLLRKDYQAAFIATGAHIDKELGIEGQELVKPAMQFLRDANLGRAPTVGARVVVVGGGNSATDSARVALRLGGHEVTIVYRRSREQMPTNSEELAQSEAEGVKIRYLSAPIAVLANGGHVVGLRCARTELSGLKGPGRGSVAVVSGTDFDIPADTVISAVGQNSDTSWANGCGILMNGTRVRVDESFMTSRDRVYAGGDVVSGPARVVDAIAHGRRAAEAISEALGRRTRGPTVPIETVKYEEINKAYYSHEQAQVEQETKSGGGSLDFGEIKLGFQRTQASHEASRCFQCGRCKECANCWLFCPDASISPEGGHFTIDYDFCKGCGICAKECPTGAFVMEQEDK